MKKQEIREIIRNIKRHRPTNITKLIDNCINTRKFQPMYDIDYKCYYDGYLSLYNMGITKLPNNFIINGNLNCSKNNLTTLPNNLIIYGWLDCSENNLTSFPMNIKVTDTLWAYDNSLRKMQKRPSNVNKWYLGVEIFFKEES